MPYVPGAEPGRIGPHAYQCGLDYASLIHPVSPDNAIFAISSHANCDSVVNNGYAITPALTNQSAGIHLGFNGATLSASLSLRLEGSGILDSRPYPDSPPLPGTVLYAVTLFPSPSYISPLGPTGSPRGFGAAEDEDDIVTEHVLTGTPPVQQDSPRSRPLSHQLVFNSGSQSPAPLPFIPSFSHRVFSVPVPTFEVPPEVPLPPSAESSYISGVHPEDSLVGANGTLHVFQSDWISPRPPVSTRLGDSNSTYFRLVTHVSPLNVHHPRAIAWVRLRRVHSKDAMITNYDYSVVSYSDPWNFGTDGSSGSLNDDSSFAAFTPAVYNEASSLDSGNSNIQAENNTSIEQYHAGVASSSITYHVLEYPDAETFLEIGNTPPPSVPPQSTAKFDFTFNYSRTGTLPPHPSGYLHRPEQHNWTYNLPNTNAPFSFTEDPSSSDQIHSGWVRYSTESGSFESTFSSYTKSSASHTEIVGNRPAWSPFGPAIDLGSSECTSATSSTNEPTRPVRIRPLAIVPASHGVQIDSPSPISLTELDVSVDESMPPTPCPPPRESHTQYPSVESAYNHGIEPTSNLVPTPENTLPPFGYPENPCEVTLPSIGQILGETNGGEVLEMTDESEELEAPGENVGLDMPAQSWYSQVPGELEGLKVGTAIEWFDMGDESEGSEGGHEGDDEDESDNEDEYDQYFSSDEDEFVDLAYTQFTQSSRSQQSVLEYPWSGSSPFVLDYYSSEGSAHSDDGHVGYSTDPDAE